MGKAIEPTFLVVHDDRYSRGVHVGDGRGNIFQALFLCFLPSKGWILLWALTTVPMVIHDTAC